MSRTPSITVLYGGVGPEREIALVTGHSVIEALRPRFAVVAVELRRPLVPADIDPEQTVVFPALHGDFGEDGQIQAMLEARGIDYAGSDARASRICIHKRETKAIARRCGIGVLPDSVFAATFPPPPAELIARLGTDLVIKPEDKGSSVGLELVETAAELEAALAGLRDGCWMAEQRLRGREFSIGLLEGRALGVVELIPRGGVYDYRAKYTAGETDYRFPAEVDETVREAMTAAAETLFAACGCRDFARADFLLSPAGEWYLLEINTLPGLTPTSLLPKSASCFGYTFETLTAALVEPAIRRWQARRRKGGDPHGA